MFKTSINEVCMKFIIFTYYNVYMSLLEYSNHLLENTDHVTEVSYRNLYFACFKGDISNEKGSLHWHDAFECIYVNKGRLDISVGLNHFVIEEGNMILINSDVLHELTSSNSDVCSIISCVFHPFFISNERESIIYHKYIKPIVTNPSFQYYLINHSSFYINDFLSVISAYDNESFGYEIRLRNLFSNLLVDISNNLPANPKMKTLNFNPKESRLRLMSDYIHKNYFRQITLKDIANSAMVSESECLRCFNTVIHITPIRYLVDYRLRVSRHLLIESNLKIESICMDVGFQDFSYFTKAFKKMYGMSPREYRKNYSNHQ